MEDSKTAMKLYCERLTRRSWLQLIKVGLQEQSRFWKHIFIKELKEQLIGSWKLRSENQYRKERLDVFSLRVIA